MLRWSWPGPVMVMSGSLLKGEKDNELIRILANRTRQIITVKSFLSTQNFCFKILKSTHFIKKFLEMNFNIALLDFELFKDMSEL